MKKIRNFWELLGLGESRIELIERWESASWEEDEAGYDDAEREREFRDQS